MFKRIVLFVATFAVIGIAFTIYQWGEEKVPQHVPIARKTLPSLTSQPTTQESGVQQTIGFKGAKIPAGESPKVTILDDKGNAKIVFKASYWKPMSDTSFEMTAPEARLLLPGGQLAYVWADKGQVELERGDGNSYDPKKGWLRGHVRIVVDRSKPEWRQANPELAEPEQHPEMLVKIWLDDVDFDLDLGRLESAGPITLQSADGSMEGRGLELLWSESDRQIRKLRIIQGKRATIRNTGIMDFGAGGEVKTVTTRPSAETQPAVELATKPPAKKTKQQPTAELQRDETLQFQNLEEDALSEAKANRVDTYKIEFHDHVVAEQKEGVKTTGGLKADLLQLVCDIGREERAAVEHTPTSQPTSEHKKKDKEKKDNQPETRPAIAAVKEAGQIQVDWTGELVATPVAKQTTQPAEERKAPRFHLIATGSPVELFDSQQGGGTCQKLEYHGETKQVWLTGTPDALVVMNAGPDRQLAGEKIFFDRRLGVATVEGAGHMSDLRQHRETDALPECMRQQAGLAEPDAGEITHGADIHWSKKVAIEFAVGSATEQKPDESAGPDKLSGYVRHAVFEGRVVMNQQDELIQADHVEAFFAPPSKTAAKGSPLDRSTNVENLIATGNVHMQRTGGAEAKTKIASQENVDELFCDRLEVDMTTDDAGHNVPKVGRALGNVHAKRVSAQGRREIQTQDKLVLLLASVPKVVEPQERERLEAAAKRCGIGPDSEVWKAIETKLRNRRKMVATAINAEGGIKVHMLRPGHPDDTFDMTADTIDCTLREDEEITRALIVGSEESPAEVDTGDIYVKGPRISIDMPTQTLDVPGVGRMRFMTKQDLTGRPTGKPVPVVVNWQDRMSFRGQKNIGTFTGAVHAVSSNTSLDSKELRIEFENLPSAASAPASSVAITERWLLKPLFASGRGSKKSSPTNRMTEQMRKRPTQIWAVGDAVIISTDYAKPAPLTGPLTRLVQAVLPARLSAPASQPAETLQIQSRFRVAGPQIRVDLIEEHFSVEGQGNLLVEDRRLPQPHASKAAGAPESALSPNLTALDSSGPSQTLFQWQNSMSYLNKRNVAVFQHRVVMDHLSGSKMAYAKELMASANLDPQQLARIKSRQAHMSSDNLTVQFDRQAGGMRAAAVADTPLSRVTRLKTFQATGQVLLELDEGKQSVNGTLVSYDDDSGDMFVTGSPGSPAQIMEQDEKTGKWRMVKADPGKAIEWNQRTQVLRMKGGSVVATSK